MSRLNKRNRLKRAGIQPTPKPAPSSLQPFMQQYMYHIKKHLTAYTAGHSVYGQMMAGYTPSTIIIDEVVPKNTVPRDMRRKIKHDNKRETRRTNKVIPVLPKEALHDPYAIPQDLHRRAQSQCPKCTAVYLSHGKRMPPGSAFFRPPTVAAGERCMVCNFKQYGTQGDNIRKVARELIRFDLLGPPKDVNSTEFDVQFFTPSPVVLSSRELPAHVVNIKLAVWEASRTCPHCKKLFESTTRLASHIAIHHKDEPLPKGP